MVRKVFYSFHFKNDSWRTGQVRNIGVVEGNCSVTDHKWEEVEKGGDKAIERWINDNLFGRSCTIVLIGSQTADRKWINYEIEKSWRDGKGILGIYIHGLKNSKGEQETKGKNPFEGFEINGKSLSSIVKAYNPPFSTSVYIYDHIKENISSWVEEAIAIRNKY